MIHHQLLAMYRRIMITIRKKINGSKGEFFGRNKKRLSNDAKACYLGSFVRENEFFEGKKNSQYLRNFPSSLTSYFFFLSLHFSLIYIMISLLGFFANNLDGCISC